MRRASDLSVVVLGLLALLVCGCGESRPEGMPEVYPAVITITQGSANLAGATVTLFPQDSALSQWPAGGVTDESGKAALKTYGKFAGAPAGKFKVMVNKTVTEGDPLPAPPSVDDTPEERAAYDRAMKTGARETFQVVAQEYRTAAQTPLTVEIKPDGENAFTLDVGAAVKEKDVQASVTSGAADGEYVPMGAGQ